MLRRLTLALLLALIAAPASAWNPFKSGPYTLTVVGGSGSGSYKGGEKVTLSAPAPTAGQTLAWLSGGPKRWGSRPQDFSDVHAATTVFTMPSRNETVQLTISTSE